MHQLARMGTRIWSSRGRQTARREAFGACADNREQRLWVEEGRGWCVPTLTKCPFEPVDQERKKPEARGAEEEVVLAHPRVLRKVKGQRPAPGVSQSEG